MLNINKNNIFLVYIYILILFIELFHFGSDIYIIFALQSFLCFSILLYFISSIFQKMFSTGVSLITIKYSYIYGLYKNIMHLFFNRYSINMFQFFYFIYVIIKKLKNIWRLKNVLKRLYVFLILILKKHIIKNKLNLQQKQISYYFN